MEDDIWKEDIDDDELCRIPLGDVQSVDISHGEKRASDSVNQVNKRLKASQCTGCKAAIHTCNSEECSSPPLQKFRQGYLWVSDLTAQCWCEQQVVYKFTLPGVVEKKPEMSVGTDLHLARELEVQDVVQVKVTSDEDIFAVKVMNLYGAVQALVNGAPVFREIPIFGAPFGQDVFVIGMIDEMRCDTDSFNFDIFEFKTRLSRSLPSQAQKDTHKMQVLLYKKLFDDLVMGITTKQTIQRHLKLDLGRPLGDDVRKHCKQTQSRQQPSDYESLDSLLDYLGELMQSVPCISQTFIEYCHQESHDTIGIEAVSPDTDWLNATFVDYVTFWRGEREARGVDIEDAWKCARCDFADVCEWRQKKQEEYSSKNKIRNKIGT